MSVLYVTIADSSNVLESKNITRKICNTLSLKWEYKSSKIIKNN